MKRSETIQTRIDPELKNLAELRAKSLHLNVSEYVRELMINDVRTNNLTNLKFASSTVQGPEPNTTELPVPGQGPLSASEGNR